MGIPHLFKWLRGQNYRGVLRRNVPRYISSFSFDFNGIIHEVAQTVYAYGAGENARRKKLVEKADPKILEAEFYQALATKLTQVISQVAPQEVLVLAVDGVAPQAKIAQQRQRRFRSAMDSSGDNVFNSSCITPGTEFMKRLDNFLQRWLIASAKSLPPKVIYSSHTVPGEGEHKILDLIRKGEISGEGSHVIYGMDADLIMLSLLAPIEKISLMREDITSIIDIDNLRSSLIEDLGSIDDFVVMIFLLGNDFLPHLVALADLDESIETMMRTYKMNGSPLTKDKEIDWDGLSSYLKALAGEEHRLLELESIRDVKHPSRMMNLATERNEKISSKIQITSNFKPDIFRAAWYENAFQLKAKNNVFKKLLPEQNFGTSNNKIVDLAKMFLTGIAWVYRYYSSGKDFVNNDYLYTSHYGPLLSDMALVADMIGKKFEIKKESYHFNPNAIEINPVHQLLSVLPLKSKDLLPFEVAHLTKNDSIIADYFPEEEIIERDGMNTDWQGVILINFVDMDRIVHAVETTAVFTEERIKEFSPTYNIILKRDSSKDDKTKNFREFLSRESRGRGYQGKTQGRGYSQRSQGYQGKTQDRGYSQKSQGYSQKSQGYQGKTQGYSHRSQGYQGKTQGRGYSQKQNNKKEIPPLPNFPTESSNFPNFNKKKPLEVKKFEL